MPLAEQIISTRYSIQAYDVGQITINEQPYSESLILSADQLISPWPVRDVKDLQPEYLQVIVEMNPEVILLGTGEKQHFPDMEIIGFFARLGLGVEVMNNGAVCRTFNILAAEDRQVVAAIIQSSI